MTDGIRLYPDCGAEFLMHVETCSDCGTTLVAPDELDSLDLEYHEDLVAVSYPDGPVARRYIEALADARIPSGAHWATFADESQHRFLFVRPEDEADARRLAAEVEMPTVDLREMEPLERVDEWFTTPDLAPGWEEATALEKARWARTLAIAGVFAVSFGVFAVDSPVVAWGGALAAVVGIAWRARQRALADRLRQDRERTAVGITEDAHVLPGRLDDGPSSSHLGI